MYVCMCVCIYIYIYIYMCVCVWDSRPLNMAPAWFQAGSRWLQLGSSLVPSWLQVVPAWFQLGSSLVPGGSRRFQGGAGVNKHLGRVRNTCKISAYYHIEVFITLF